MPKIPTSRRGTGLQNSDVAELVAQWNQSQYWVLNSAIALSTATYSASGFNVLASGTVHRFTASTGAGFTGLNIITGNVAVCVAWITSTGGTHNVAMANSAASIGVAALPTFPATGYAYGLIIIGTAGAASGFTGGTTVLDGTNASALFFNLNGPSGMALSTASISVVPG